MQRLRWMISEQRHLVDGVLQTRYQVLWRLGNSPKTQGSDLCVTWDEAFDLIWRMWGCEKLTPKIPSVWCKDHLGRVVHIDFCQDCEDPSGQTIRARGKRQYDKEIAAYEDRRRKMKTRTKTA